MSAWLVPAFATAAGVLALSGAAKLRSPRPAVQALEAVGVRVRAPAVRGLGLGELTLGAVCLLEPSPGPAHVVLNLVGTTIALAATIWVPAPLLEIGGPLVAITVLAGIGAATYLSYLAFTALPGAWAAYGGR